MTLKNYQELQRHYLAVIFAFLYQFFPYMLNKLLIESTVSK